MLNRYIVVFKETASEGQIEQYIDRLIAEGGKIHANYDALFKGFSAFVPDSLVQLFAQDDLIDYIEADGVVTIQS
ncbi:hypothetical protein D9756_005264 [Leucocoprinus leucothites]|uniref:Inhibitor I9 domain-containing protein n=1 Tax=Leucocoprinus leucothites TaxID=201217 RepID=A0A8H5D7D9_9AGAR|nr:hypothetical protein D9756_005264 [Leucoagaricus leucothites]